MECKVLALPFTHSKLLNVAQKLGPVDSESFHSKLQRKAKWLRATATFKDVELLSLLVVDEAAFLGREAPTPVIDIQSLPALVVACERHVKTGDGRGTSTNSIIFNSLVIHNNSTRTEA